MSDRLADLQRQRALAQEQVAWFDREIARESGQAPAPAAPVSLVPPPPAPPSAAATDVAAARAADEILAQYRKPVATTTSDVKKGCYLYFLFALGMLALCVASLYIIYANTR